MKRIIRCGAISVGVLGAMLALAGVALAVDGGLWSGHTSQPNSTGKLPFALRVRDDRVTQIYYAVDLPQGHSAPCSSTAELLVPKTGFNGLKIKHRKFRGSIQDSRNGAVTVIKGRFSGNRVSGSVRYSAFNQFGTCSTGNLTFSGKRGGTFPGG